MKEITGSGIFVANGEDDPSEAGSTNPNKTGVRMYQVLIYVCLHARTQMLLHIVSVIKFG